MAMTRLQAQMVSFSDTVFEALDYIGADADFSPEFHAEVRSTFGDDFHRHYLEWVAVGQSSGVPQ